MKVISGDERKKIDLNGSETFETFQNFIREEFGPQYVAKLVGIDEKNLQKTRKLAQYNDVKLYLHENTIQ
jgi:hypothetical protein